MIRSFATTRRRPRGESWGFTAFLLCLVGAVLLVLVFPPPGASWPATGSAGGGYGVLPAHRPHGLPAPPTAPPSAPTPALVATAVARSASPFAPSDVQFNGSVVGGVPPYAATWSFGDGSRGANLTAQHLYTVSGNYTALLSVTDALGHTASSSTQVALATPGPVTNANLTLTGPVASPPSTFWSVALQTTCARCILTNGAVGSFLNQTPFTWFRYGAGSDSCDPRTNLAYNNDGVASVGCAFNLSALKAWCDARTTPCHVILGLPGENNNSALDAAIAAWIVNVVGLQPDYWSIGNEPTQWTHYGLPWSAWRTSDDRVPTALAYAWDVHAAIAAVRAVDPAARFIGIQAACYCNSALLTEVAAVDGSEVNAFAYHLYPAPSVTTNETIASYLSPLAGPGNISSSYASVRSEILTGCPTCGALPIFIDEYNAGPGWSPAPLDGSYANALFLGASVAQALTANISQLTPFNLQNGSDTGLGYSMLNRTGAPGPTGLLFSQVLSHLAFGTVLGERLATAIGGIWSVATAGSGLESLLLVNSNATESLILGTASLPGLAGAGTQYLWDEGMSAPAMLSTPGATDFVVPPLSLLLVDVPTSGGAAPVPTAQSPGPAATGGAPPAGADGAILVLPVAAAVPFALGIRRAGRAPLRAPRADPPAPPSVAQR
jgi:hypothetical protein